MDKLEGIDKPECDIRENCAIRKTKRRRKNRYLIGLLIRFSVAAAIFGFVFLVASFSSGFSNFISTIIGFDILPDSVVTGGGGLIPIGR